jgi:hypothetical protein
MKPTNQPTNQPTPESRVPFNKVKVLMLPESRNSPHLIDRNISLVFTRAHHLSLFCYNVHKSPPLVPTLLQCSQEPTACPFSVTVFTRAHHLSLFCYSVHKSPPPVPILNHINSVHILPSYFFKIHCTIIFPSVPRSSKWSLSFSFPHWKHLCIFLSFVYHTPHPAHPPWLVSRIICGKEYKLHSSLLCNLLWPTYIFSFLRPSSFFSTTQFWNTLKPGFLLNVADQVPHIYDIAWSEFRVF